jgi:hypothetical protein
VTIRLESVTRGTRLHSDFAVRPHGWFRLVFPLFLARIRKGESANMTYLREALERRAGRSEKPV